MLFPLFHGEMTKAVLYVKRQSSNEMLITYVRSYF